MCGVGVGIGIVYVRNSPSKNLSRFKLITAQHLISFVIVVVCGCFLYV